MKGTRIERIDAFAYFNELKGRGFSTKEIIEKVRQKFSIPKGTLYCWAEGRNSPLGSIGKLASTKELFYVLGAMLGDGCIYHWRNEHQVWLIGDERFTKKFANKLSVCIGGKVKNYKKRKRNYWFVKISNIQLYNLFHDIRRDLQKLTLMIEKGDYYENSTEFIEGLFDAEGCVKIIKEKVRKTPKICLDITNTNKAILDIARLLLKSTLNIEAHYSIQKADGIKNKQTAYHLRIYKKEYVKKFFETLDTTKLKPEKEQYLQNWLNYKNKGKIISPLPSDNSSQPASN